MRGLPPLVPLTLRQVASGGKFDLAGGKHTDYYAGL